MQADKLLQGWIRLTGLPAESVAFMAIKSYLATTMIYSIYGITESLSPIDMLGRGTEYVERYLDNVILAIHTIVNSQLR